MAKCINHLPKIIVFKTNGKYKIHALWDRDNKPTSLQGCIDFMHGMGCPKGLSDTEKVQLYLRGYSVSDAEFFADKVDGHYVLKIDEYSRPRDFGIAKSRTEAQRRLKKAALRYSQEWVDGVKQELHEVQTQTGRWDPEINNPFYRTSEYISRLEQEVRNFELINLS